MICTKCGARLMEGDQFCPKCGARTIKEKRCPDCGAVLRDGVKFCPECGRAVGGRKKKAKVSDETLDIPIEAIERNILSETAAEIKAERGSGRGTKRTASDERTAVRRASDQEVRKKKASVPAPPPRKKKPVYREEVWEEEDWEEEEDDDDNWEDDDWDDDDWDDEGEGIDAITIMTVVIGCILLIVVAVLGFHMYRQYMPRNYDKAAEKQEEESQEESREDGQEQEETESGGAGTDAVEAEGRETYTLTVVAETVNVRDQPSTSGTNILKKAYQGENYTCYGSAGDGNWYEILLEDGSSGFVHGDYVSVE